MSMIGVLGCGRWGTYLANHFCKDNNLPTKLYGKSDSETFINLQQDRKNEYIDQLDENLILTSDLEYVLDSDIIIFALTSSNLIDLVNEIHQSSISLSNKEIIVAMKGFVITSENICESAVKYVATQFQDSNVYLLSGPGHVQNLVNNIPTHMELSKYYNSFDLLNEATPVLINLDELDSDILHITFNTISAEQLNLASSIKNLIGFMSGALVAANLKSLVGFLMVKACKEFYYYLQDYGYEADGIDCVYGISFLGDFEATLFSNYSKNFNAGYQLVDSNYEILPSNDIECVTVANMIINDNLSADEYPLFKGISDLIKGNVKSIDSIKNILLDLNEEV